MAYIDDLNTMREVTFDKILGLASHYLPEVNRNAPWIGLNHGTKVLQSETELCQYLCAYGNLHRNKINIALDTIKNTESLSKDLIIFDWGCGQGLASMCLIDYLRNEGLHVDISKIILIEPSKCALNRAVEHLNKYVAASKIVAINKCIDDVDAKQISINKGNVVHLFSNILDIPTVNLQTLHDKIESEINTFQTFICVGPNNIGATRIENFAGLFNISNEVLLGRQIGNLVQGGTINLLVFEKKGDEIEVVKTEFQVHRPTQNNGLTTVRQLLMNVTPAENDIKRLEQFFELVVRLERMKSGEVKDDYPTGIHVDENADQLTFNIDVEENEDFANLFRKNFDRRYTQWPKNLNIGLCIIINNKCIRLLQYVFSQEDLRAIDISKQFIPAQLSSFSVSADAAENLELSQEVVSVIESVLYEPTVTLDRLEQVLRDAIAHDLKLYELRLALTDETPALSQTTAELNNLINIEASSLLHSFLSGNVNNNKLHHIDEDVLISVVPMDKSQRRAVCSALNQKVSVVTGPPGTGKTQMIVNLIANALLFGKKVLVASKNNKAVDNVKERFDGVDPTQYLLRFGSKDAINNQLMPSLQRFINYIPQINSADIDEHLFAKYKRAYSIITEGHKKLCELNKNRDDKKAISEQIITLLNRKEEAKVKFNRDIQSLENSQVHPQMCFDTYADIALAKERIIAIYQKINRHKSWLRRLLFNLFSKTSSVNDLQGNLLHLPSEFNDVLKKEVNISDTSIEGLICSCKKSIFLLDEVIKYKNGYQKIKRDHCSAISLLDTQMETCKAKEEELERRISAIDEDAIFKSIKEEFQYIESVELGKRLLNQLILKRLSQNDAIAKISSYMQSMPLNGQLASSFLDVFNLNCVTNLSIKSAFPLERDLIDLLIIDEASQCDISSALPIIQRSKQIVVIGDPMQLKHITNVTSYEEGEIKAALNLTENNRASYRDVSLWDYCNTLLNSTGATSVVLDNHFRCNYGIIGYSKEFFYRRRLGINLNIKTTPGNANIDQEGIIWEDVIGSQKNEMQNINEEEAKRCIEIAEKLAKKYPDISIGIISPFKHQAQEISSMIHKDLSGQIVSDTVHKFQGDEKDVIIYSLVVTDDSSEGKIRWIDYSVPNLVNVAVTRARKALYVVGNLHYIQTHSSIDLPLGYLAWYAENKQKINLDSSNQTFVIDTNVFIEDSDILERINPRDLIVLPAKVLDELDKLKTSKDLELKGKAELALRKIKNAGKNRKIRYEIGAVELLPVDFNAKNADNIILSLAIKYRNQNAVLLTSDNGLISKAKAVRVNVKSLKELQ